MISERIILKEAIENCIKEMYKYCIPKVSWEEFKELNKQYGEKQKEWEQYRKAQRENSNSWEEWQRIRPEWKDKNMQECIGPKPYEFYYLPEPIFKDIVELYRDAYNIDPGYKDYIDTITHFCEHPYELKTIDDDFIKNLPSIQKKISDLLIKKLPTISDEESISISDSIWKQVLEYISKGTNTILWNSRSQSFNLNVYLGCGPSSNKSNVISNWKQYHNKDIEINDQELIDNYKEQWN